VTKPETYSTVGRMSSTGGDGNDWLVGTRDRGQRDKLYCGEGRDEYLAGKQDYVDSSCGEKTWMGRGVP
jgi:hypothetical protein